jgi:CheY-like chemotaxis protein
MSGDLNTAKELLYNEKDSSFTPAKKGRILCVDDDPTVLDVIKMLLEHYGYEVITAVSPFEAIEIFQAREFDLVLTDLKMPGMDGFELSQKLLKREPNISILMCSGSCAQIDEKEYIKTGIKGLIAKPFSIGRSAKIIDEVIAQARIYLNERPLPA